MATDTFVSGQDDRENHPLRVLRKALGISSQRLGDESGLGRLMINAIEKGKNKGSSAKVQVSLAKVLRLTQGQVGDLLEGHLAVADALAISKRAAGPSLAQIVAAHPGRWTPADVAGAERAAASEGAFAQGWEGLLDDLKAIRENPGQKPKAAKKSAPARKR